MRFDTTEQIVDSVTYFLEHFVFETTDFYENHPLGEDQEAKYEIRIIKGWVATAENPTTPNAFPPIGGPLVEPMLSDDVPFHFEFSPYELVIVEEDDDHIVLSILTSNSNGSSLSRYENGVETELTGTLLIEVLK